MRRNRSEPGVWRGRRRIRAPGWLAWVGAGAAVAPPAVASAQDLVPSQECCLPLLFPIGARTLALGDAVTARSDPGALFANPAVLAGIESDQFIVHTASTELERSNTFSLLIRSEVAGTFGLSYRLLDHGEQTATDPSGNPIGTLSVVEQVLTASYATRVVAGLSAGVNYKLYQLRQDCRGFCGIEPFAATTHGIDAGLQYRPIPVLEVGASLLHFGFPLQVVNAEQASPLPTRYRVGAAYEVLHHVEAGTAAEFWLLADVVGGFRDGGSPITHVGAELAIDRSIFLWSGWSGGTGLFAGGAVGVGLRYSRFDVAVAKSFVATVVGGQEPFQVSFGLRF